MEESGDRIHKRGNIKSQDLTKYLSYSYPDLRFPALLNQGMKIKIEQSEIFVIQ